MKGGIFMELLTVNELVRELGLSRRVIYTALRKGQIRGVKLGKCHYIPKTELERILKTGSAHTE